MLKEAMLYKKMEGSENTPLKTLTRAYDIGKNAGLRYVYLGNVDEGNNTYCYECGKLLIERFGYSIKTYRVKEGRCPDCNSSIDGVGL
jgi:pyruvate formate lyase activating enzyme